MVVIKEEDRVSKDLNTRIILFTWKILKLFQIKFNKSEIFLQ